MQNMYIFTILIFIQVKNISYTLRFFPTQLLSLAIRKKYETLTNLAAKVYLITHGFLTNITL